MGTEVGKLSLAVPDKKRHSCAQICNLIVIITTLSLHAGNVPGKHVCTISRLWVSRFIMCFSVQTQMMPAGVWYESRTFMPNLLQIWTLQITLRCHMWLTHGMLLIKVERNINKGKVNAWISVLAESRNQRSSLKLKNILFHFKVLVVFGCNKTVNVYLCV